MGTSQGWGFLLLFVWGFSKTGIGIRVLQRGKLEERENLRLSALIQEIFIKEKPHDAEHEMPIVISWAVYNTLILLCLVLEIR